MYIQQVEPASNVPLSEKKSVYSVIDSNLYLTVFDGHVFWRGDHVLEGAAELHRGDLVHHVHAELDV